MKCPPRPREVGETTNTEYAAMTFAGFIVNVSGAVTQLELGGDFHVGTLPQDDVAALLSRIEGKGYMGGITHLLDYIKSHGYYCVSKLNAARFTSTPQGGVVIQVHETRRLQAYLNSRIRLLRLAKEGNPVLCLSLMYHMRDDSPKVVTIFSSRVPVDITTFTLRPDEVSAVQSLLDAVSLPLSQDYLRLALESFEVSYEVEDATLAFLSLMVAMEVMFNPGEYELTYQIARHTAVLLGQDRNESESIFQSMKKLYGKRSKIVHGGSRSVVTHKDVIELRQYVRQAIKEALRVAKPKKPFLALLDTCGFGERPWRDEA